MSELSPVDKTTAELSLTLQRRINAPVRKI